MAVSFLSKPLPSTPYVSKIDSNILFGAMLHKQQAYDQGLQRVDQLKNTLDQQDIVNDGHRAYYEQKMAAMTEQLNNLGAADFSDRSVLQEIGGLKDQIVKDPRIMGAIQSTKYMRSAIDQNEKWKTDRKKYPDMWHPANENWLNNEINAYRTSESPDAKFTASARPYVNHPKRINDRLKQVTDQIIKMGGYTSSDGQHFTTVTKVDPERIRSIVEAEMAQDSSIGQQLDMERDMHYQGQPEQAIRQGATQLLDNQIQIRTNERKQLAERSILKNLTGAQQEEYKQALTSYDTALEELGKARQGIATYPIDRLKDKLYKDAYVIGYQNTYAGEARKQTYDPSYGVGVNDRRERAIASMHHGEFLTKEARQGYEFNMTYQLEQDKLLLEQLKAESAADKDRSSKLGVYKNEDGTYSDLSPWHYRTVDGGSEAHPTQLSDLSAGIEETNKTLNGTMRDMLRDFMGGSDLNALTQYDKKIAQSRQVVGKNGAVNERFPTGTFQPMEIAAITQLYDQYNNLQNGLPVDQDFLNKNLSTRGRQLFNQMQKTVMLQKLQKEQYQDYESRAIKASGMNTQKVSRMNELENLAKTKPDLFKDQYQASPIAGNPASVPTPYQQELTQLRNQFKKGAEAIAPQMAQYDTYRKDILVTDPDALKPDSPMMTSLRHAIGQGKLNQDGKPAAQTAAERSALQNQVFTDVTINRKTGQITFSATEPKVDGKPGKTTGPYVLDTADTGMLEQVLPHAILAEPSSPVSMLQNQLDKTGNLNHSGKALPFAVHGPGLPPVGFTVQKVGTTGQYQFGYTYQGKNIPLPSYRVRDGGPVLPMGDIAQGAVKWLDGRASSWFANTIQPLLIKRYGKGDPNYLPTVEDFHNLMQDPTLFTR